MIVSRACEPKLHLVSPPSGGASHDKCLVVSNDPLFPVVELPVQKNYITLQINLGHFHVIKTPCV